MTIEESVTELARRVDRRSLLGRTLFTGFVGLSSAALGVKAKLVEASCSSCSPCASNWCSCSNCYDNGNCNVGCGIDGVCWCVPYYSCGYPSSGCWTINSGAACCDCDACPGDNSPCTCRPRGYGC